MMKETIAQAAAEALNELWAGETHDGEMWRADGHEAQTIAAAVITAQQQTAAARDALNEARLLLVELLADKGGLIKHAPGAWAMGGALEMRLRGLLATPADPGAKLAEAIEQRDAAEAVVERVVALAAAWNDTPDYQPSDYDRGRVDQRHDMTIQLAEVVGHAASTHRCAAVDAVERVRAIIEPHTGHELSRAEKFGRTKPDCVCELCQVLAALDGVPEPEREYGAGLESDPSNATPHPDKETALVHVAGWNRSVERMSRAGRRNSGPAVLVERRPAGPWKVSEGDQ